MSRMLTSSRLLPATILAIVAVLATRSVSLIGSGPASGGATREAGLGFGLVGQAHAAGESSPARPAA
ncbi:MAG: hypothetical protein H7Z10_07530, partial [Gemmatimonadaceae bacterium]|nr:hypothetical protein [Acetobacteraceae bacterium]